MNLTQGAKCLSPEVGLVWWLYLIILYIPPRNEELTDPAIEEGGAPSGLLVVLQLCTEQSQPSDVWWIESSLTLFFCLQKKKRENFEFPTEK